MFMATSLLVIDLSLVAMVATLENGGENENENNIDAISLKYTILMTSFGFGSYLLVVSHLFFFPNCLSVYDLFTLYNIG